MHADMHSADRHSTSARLGLAVIATPLLWLAAEVVSPPLKPDSAAQLAVIAAHPHRWYWYTVLLIAGTITLIPAALGIARLASAGARKLATIGATLIGFSGVVAVGDAMTQFLSWQMVTGSADRAQMTALLDRYDNSSAASIFFLPGGLALLVGTAMLATALWRAHIAARWVTITFGAGLTINLVGFMATSVAVIALGAALMTPACVLHGGQLLGTMRRPADVSRAPASATA